MSIILRAPTKAHKREMATFVMRSIQLCDEYHEARIVLLHDASGQSRSNFFENKTTKALKARPNRSPAKVINKRFGL